MLKEKRSYIMSMVKSKNTRPEMIVRKYLFAKGFRYRVNMKMLPGKPDIVLRKYGTVIFINGCFWHGHDCPEFRPPKTRVDYWMNKIDRNKERDLEVREKLRKLGWRTMIIWECQLKSDVRQSTLDGVALLLEKAYLDMYRLKGMKAYQTIDESFSKLVAEPLEVYGKVNKD